MEMDVAIARIKLRGRLDSHGVDKIETKFTAWVVPPRRTALVDLSEVSLVTSMGFRMFITVARALNRHNAKMILFAPQPQVSDLIASARLNDIVSVVPDESEALRAVT